VDRAEPGGLGKNHAASFHPKQRRFYEGERTISSPREAKHVVTYAKENEREESNVLARSRAE